MLLCLVPLAAVLDAGPALVRGAPAGAAAVVAIAAGAVALVLCALVAPFVVGLGVASERIRAMAGGRWLWLTPVAVTSLALSWAILEPRAHAGAFVFGVLAVVAAAAATGLVWFGTLVGQPAARLALLVAFVGGVVADAYAPRVYYPEIQDVTELLAAIALLGLARVVRGAVLRGPLRVLAPLLLVSVLAAGFVLLNLDGWAPGWRSVSANESRVAVRLVRLGRWLWDRDGDGYSPLLGGGDCKDDDGSAFPGALDLPGGGDNNCNGVDPPTAPTPADLGLVPSKAAPHLAVGALRVVLLSIDTFRPDVLTREYMPALTAFAERGVRFERFYASGTLTPVSVPLFVKPSNESPSVVTTLTAQGIRSEGVSNFSLNYGVGEYNGVPRDAKKQTETTIRRFAALEGTRSLLWTHYLDLHDCARREGFAWTPVPPPLTPCYAAQARYLDHHLQAFLAALEASPDRDRTVVIVTGDHGEGLGAHGVFTHGVTGYEEVLRTVAFVVAPGVAPARYPHLVSHRGLPATLLGAFGLEKEARGAEQFGQSWLRAAAAPTVPLHEFIVSRSSRFSSGLLIRSPLGIIVEGRYKLVAGLQDGLVELYDLDADPHERVNLGAANDPIVAQLLGKLALYSDLDKYPRSDSFREEQRRYGAR
jgi:hypothetical protein